MVSKKNEKKSNLDTNLSLVALAMLAILFLVEKTPFVVLSLLAMIFACLIRPVVHAVREISTARWLKYATVVVLVIGTVAFGYHVWPPLSSDLRVFKTEVYPFVPSRQAGINLWIHNDGRQTVEYKSFYKVSTVRLVGTTPDLEWAEQDKQWDIFADEIRKNPSSRTLAVAPNTDQELPNMFGPSPPLTDSEVSALKTNSTVQFMAVLRYSDDLGTHETDYCMITMGDTVRPNCRRHNGPVKPLKIEKFLGIF